MLTRNADELVLKKVYGRSSREAALKALDSEVKRALVTSGWNVILGHIS